MSQLILAGDVGGTKTWLGLFAPDGPRPSLLETGHYTTLEFDSLTPMVARFLHRTGAADRVTAACFGVAGPVRANGSRLTNVPWVVHGNDIGTRLGIGSVRLLNDLEAMGHAVPFLTARELAVIQPGTPIRGGNAALIAPGTGLGEASLHAVDGQLRPMPSEGGHTDFAARTPREIELVAMLSRQQGRVALEDIVSGPGLVVLHTFTHRATRCAGAALPGETSRQPAAITAAALDSACEACADALDLFVSAFGAAAGNLALRNQATAGLYLGGGIAPQILPALRTGRFLEAFVDKGPMRPLLEQVPISVILDQRVVLIGAAVAARDLIAAPDTGARTSDAERADG
jgi:glucokinase